MNGIEFGPIKPSLKNAKAVQRLTLQDVVLGGFPNPDALANPHNPQLVSRQYKKLRHAPDNYFGVYAKDGLVGYLKTAEWTIADELPFAKEQEREWLTEMQEATGATTIDPNYELGIFGLVVSDRLAAGTQKDIAERFLDVAVDRGIHLGMTAVNAVFHDNDPVWLLAREHGWQFTGRTGEASGAPGITQRLYKKYLDS
ncbi:MAG TPA: hypothetical protein VN081_01500 [Dongiaceae bacterium]|nr:hypothetical protein [Dongiaceae bacterium]